MFCAVGGERTMTPNRVCYWQTAPMPYVRMRGGRRLTVGPLRLTIGGPGSERSP